MATSTKKAPKPTTTEETRAIREWAAKNGVTVSPVGRLPHKVVADYRSATRTLHAKPAAPARKKPVARKSTVKAPARGRTSTVTAVKKATRASKTVTAAAPSNPSPRTFDDTFLTKSERLDLLNLSLNNLDLSIAVGILVNAMNRLTEALDRK